ncbi:putative CtpA-like serine protease [Aquisphaera giovannonii]|uniref:Putative CtpA-like serine protease n=1 Tax=Aquisphaera giovannonii TaxID=406548 RepID=A0A5B9VYL7_9BACT|nr:S41 family peptidase [Aquisphaera giovannonii]QEH33398.1 putative CtpA-like serine protease [Aquisphaera giovannonii]
MRRLVSTPLTWAIAAALAWTTAANPTWARPLEAEPPSDASPKAQASPTSLDEAEAALQKGLDQERGRSWAAAIETYRKAIERWPSRSDFSRRLRLCELHFKLVRRYQDASFRNVLLKLPTEQATELYAEVIERIQSHYVDPVPLEPLVRHGLDNMEVALRDPSFLRANVGEPAADRVTWLRERLREQRSRLSVPDRDAASRQVLAACELAREALDMPATPVLLEFTCGACDALDDFTSYLTPDKLEDLYAMIDGNFVGLGVELKSDPQGLRLVGVIRGGPAWEAGLVAGDRIAGVGGKAVKGLSLDEAANRLQGAEGTTIDLEVVRRDGEHRLVRLVRRHVDVESITRAKIIDPVEGIGYVQLTGFQKSSTEELDQAISGLQALGMRTLVLDLRGNPGGLLNVAVEMADRFIEEGVIVSTRGRASGQTQVMRAGGQPRWRMPMYVLVDHDSASASEILAGALQDHHRAVIVGERSYGKGSVQSIFSLRAAPAGLKLTTAKFYSPNNRPYSEQGVSPDLPVKARIAARPAAGQERDDDRIDEAVLGDPSLDPVLAAAVRASRSGSQAAR